MIWTLSFMMNGADLKGNTWFSKRSRPVGYCTTVLKGKTKFLPFNLMYVDIFENLMNSLTLLISLAVGDKISYTSFDPVLSQESNDFYKLIDSIKIS